MATQHLSRDEQLALLGCDPALAGPTGAAERLAHYDQLRPALTAELRAYSAPATRWSAPCAPAC